MDERIRLIAMTRNGGKANAMNAAIAEARGRWIAVLDADDWYAAQRLSTMVSAGESAGVPMVADNQFLYDEGADKLVGTAMPAVADRRLDKAAFIAGSNPYAGFDFGMLKPIVRADFIGATRLTYQQNARQSEDFLYLVEFFAAGGEGLLLSQPLYYWRQTFGTISRNWTGTAGGAWRYDFVSGARSCEELRNVMQEKHERELARLLTQRMRAFQRLHRMQEMNRLRANGASAVQLARSALSQPSIWSLIMQRGVRRLARRASA
jgi:glycosyltransferase involved in cell wall biosynthesis